MAPLHQFDDSFKRLVFGNCPRAEGHDLLDLSARAMGVLLGKFARSDDKFEPLWAAPLGREFAAAEKIAFSDDPDQFTFLVHHRQAADAICSIKRAALRIGSSAPTQMTLRVITSLTRIVVLPVETRSLALTVEPRQRGPVAQYDTA